MTVALLIRLLRSWCLGCVYLHRLTRPFHETNIVTFLAALACPKFSFGKSSLHICWTKNLNFGFVYDSISHRFLHAKRNRFDIDGNVLYWVCSYLSGSSYDVGIPFDEAPCVSGVFHLSVTVPVRKGGWRCTLR